MQTRDSADSHASSADARECSASLFGGSKTFFAASLVLPRSVREPATSLYAFCRMADDAIDLAPDPARALQDLRHRLDLIYRGSPVDCPADRAFADCVRRHRIPRQFPDGLLEGFEWDASGRGYEDLPAVRDYGLRVAGTVGAMMSMVMDVRERELVASACELGIAMQFTNIARDVGEDARNGRLYLPRQWMREAGLDPQAWLERPQFSPALARVIERLLGEAQQLYRRSDAALSRLPRHCRMGMYAARLLYAEIGREVARRGFDSVNQRAVVPRRRKARILAAAWAAARRAPAPLPAIELAGADALLDACPPAAQGAADCVRPARPRIEERVAWLVDLFERLERRERAQMQAASPS